MKKGLSLILLVITIIIIIILSGSIILTILPNNVISDSKATVQKGDFKTISDEFNLYKSNLYAKTDGAFDMTTINADSTNITEICKSAEKYKDLFRIVNGNLEYTGNNTKEKALAKEYSMIYYGTEKTGTNISINNTIESTIPSLTIYGKSSQKEYGLVSTGTQYINTGIKPTNNTKVVVEFKYDAATFGSGSFVYGSRTTFSSSNKHAFIIDISLCSFPHFGSYSTNSVPGQSPVGKKLTLEVSKDGAIIKRSDGTIYNSQIIPPQTNFTSTLNMYLFALNENNLVNSRIFKGSIYNFKVYENNILIQSLVATPQGSTLYSSIPAPSNCMYDKVTGTYFQNTGTGTFSIETLTIPSPEIPIVINSANNFNLVETSKQNLIKYSEPTKSTELENSGSVTFRTATGNLAKYSSNEIYFQTPGTTAWSYFYSNILKPNKDVYLEFYIETDDGSIPILGNSTTTGDLGIVINAGLYSTTSNFTITKIDGTNVYIIASKIKFAITHNTGVVKYSGQSSKKFRVSRFKAVEDINYGYIKTTGTTITEQKNTNITSTLRGIQVLNTSTVYTYQDSSNNRYIADYIEMKNGKVNLIKNIEQITLNGNENWYKISGYDNATNVVFRMDFAKNNYFSMCDKLNVIYAGLNSVTIPTYAPSFVGNTISISKSLLIGYNDSLTDIQKVNLFKSWMSTNNIKVQYVLNTPVITDITNTEEGQALLNFKTQKGYINIYDSSGMDLWKKITFKEM